MKTIALLLSALVLAPVAAVASPTYLNCELNTSNPGKTETFSVTLDESNHSATYMSSGGNSFSSPAVFTANEITYSNEFDMDYMDTTSKYSINRTTLDLTLTTTYLYKYGSKDGTQEESSRHGKCTVVKAPTDRVI